MAAVRSGQAKGTGGAEAPGPDRTPQVQPASVKAPAGVSASVPQSAILKAKPHAADGQAALLALLKVESDARDATSVRDLVFIMANETRKLTRARQVFVMLPGLKGGYEVQGVSSLPVVDRQAPLTILIENIVNRASNGVGLSALGPIAFPETGEDRTADAYPFRSLVWVPLQHGGRPASGGLVLAREDAWADHDTVIAKRLAAAYAHAWMALKGTSRRLRLKLLALSKWQAGAAAGVIAAMFLIPVPLTALAPVEIIARDPYVVAAPIDGVVETVAVEANQTVKPGDLLIKLADTTLRNRVQMAEREVQVAEARLKQSNQVAFDDSRGMHDIGIARAELALKMAERDFARDLLAKTEIRAGRQGIAMYSDKRDLVGRPVAVGERMLEVADASMIEARIELAVADAIALAPGARVKLFLDSDPLSPFLAAVTRADYKAKAGENDIVSFRVTARLASDQGRALPRLGVRGTAQVIGGKVPLGFYLFRRPITALRQGLGL